MELKNKNNKIYIRKCEYNKLTNIKKNLSDDNNMNKM